jgi:DNA topoisomerase-1
MSSAVYDTTNIFIINEFSDIQFKSSFSNLVFDGFFAVYEYSDDEDLETKKLDLSKLKVNSSADLEKLTKKQHFTEPPARYTEAGLIKKMEEIGIGRPSTYATIVSVLQTREYVKIVQKRFQVTIRGHVITSFLVDFFPKYFAFDFTAQMENELDEVANGDINWKKLLNKFWDGFSENTQEVSKTEVLQIMNKVSNDMMVYLFPKNTETNEIENKCPSCVENHRENGNLLLKFSRFGYFLGCTNYPECSFIKSLSDNLEENNALNDNLVSQESYIFQNETTKVKLKKGRYGNYLEVESNEVKKNVGLTDEMMKDLNQELIEKLIQLPKFIGNHPDDKAEISVNLGPYGFYVAHNKIFASIGRGFDPFLIGLPEALQIFEQSAEKNKKNTKVLDSAEFGEITIKKGGFGKVYLVGKDEKKVILPKGILFAEPDLKLIEDFVRASEKKIKRGRKKLEK